MQKEKGKRKKGDFVRTSLSFLLLPFSFFLNSCGTPGDPVPPRPTVAEAVKDLAARQQGEAVVLTFTLPAKSTAGEALPEPPELEIFRASAPAGAQPDAAKWPATPLYTVPSALVDTYTADGRVRFLDPLRPETLAGSPGEELAYMVRTRASKRRASADSNVVSVRVYAVPERVTDLRAQVTASGVELEWTAPTRTTSGGPIASLGAYRVYRAGLEAGETATDLANAKLKTPLELLAVAPSASYRDTQFEFDHSYLYLVRSVAQHGADAVESADSAAVNVAPRDTFPPASPKDVVIVVVPATPESPAQIELSWAISNETDLAGYHVYRSEGQDTRGERINRELLLVPAFRDTSVAVGRRYTYRVTAVDRVGNESPPSAPVAAEVPATN